MKKSKFRQSTFAWALSVAAADENKRVGYEIAQEEVQTFRSRAEINNLRLINEVLAVILHQDAETRHSKFSVPLELFNVDYTADVYCEEGEDLTIIAVYIQDVDVLPFLTPEVIQEITNWIGEEIQERIAEHKLDQLQEQQDGIID